MPRIMRRALVSSARDLFTTAMDLPVLAIPEFYANEWKVGLSDKKRVNCSECENACRCRRDWAGSA